MTDDDDVTRVRDTLLTAAHPLVALRWLITTTHPLVIRAALNDDRVRERVREEFERVGEALRAFADALRPAVEAMGKALKQFAQPEQPPNDPRARALWLRQRRNTGPAHPGPEQRRPPRQVTS